MKQLILKLYSKFRILILYGIIGSFSSFLDFCVYTLLSQVAGIHYMVSNCVSVLVGITTSFILNRRYNFKVKDHTGQRFSIFLAVGLCGMLLSNLILYVGIDRLQYNQLIVKLASIVLVVFFQFILNKYITFRVRDEKEEGPAQSIETKIKNDNMEKVYFVMPAYNESENIKATVEQWHSAVARLNEMGGGTINAKLVIANDGSKDNTFEIMDSLTKQYPYFIALNKPNSGHGATVLYLYRYAIENGADYVFQTDSDGQTNPDEFWQMWENRENYDFQIGYRKGRQDGASRVFVTKTLRLVVWLMFHEWVTDANTPFRLMRSDKLQAIMNVIPQDYFLCNVAISAIAVKWKYAIKFYEITFKPRQGGVNSINMKRIFKIGWKALGDFRKINANLKK